NGSVGATRSEAASIKLTGMYKNIPAVAYFLASTKLTVQNGTGVWWVTLITGVVGPADREAGALQVVLRMIRGFQYTSDWKANSVANAGAVSRQVSAQSNAALQAISSSYWSRQAAQDASMNAYWNRQAVQDHAADNFSNYIRGVENVQDPNTGTTYQVQSGPSSFWMNGAGNIAGSPYTPGADWHQLMSVP
ncbi:MAG TPA: hypothetical protein V6C72_15610, partial [Chroococcales cyanobacterium]